VRHAISYTALKQWRAAGVGQAVSELSSGESLVVFQFHAGSPLPTECQSDYQTWGTYVGRLHRVGRLFHPHGEWPATLVSRPPGRWLESAWACVQAETEEAQILLACRAHILQASNAANGYCSVVHGDLWPGNILVNQGYPRAIDFSEGGLAPLVLDLATAFRWLPWEQPDLARQRWVWWLQGYEAEWRGPLPAESAVVSWAMLQQVRYLVEEVTACLEGRDGPEVIPTDYITDHAARLQRLLSVAAG
jgi:Ser/Thr protein kinase RdoA (MazF antagonist)